MLTLPRPAANIPKNRAETVALRGINFSENFQPGDLADCVNLSSRRWPYTATRLERAKQAGYQGVTALTAHGKLAAVSGNKLFYDGKAVGAVTPGEKQFATVNTKLVIWPDKVYLDLEDNKVKPLGAKLTFSPRSVTFTSGTLKTDVRPVMIEGRPTEKNEDDEYDESGPGFDIFGGIDLSLNSRTFYFRRCEAIDRTAEGWVLTGEETVKINQLKKGDLVRLDSNSMLASVWGNASNWYFDETCYAVIKEVGETVSHSATFYITYDVIYCPLKNSGKLTESFRAGDAVTISGAGDNDKDSAVIRSVSETELTFSPNSFSVGEAGEVFPEGEVTIERKVPDLAFICESQNRLWGCEGHTVYASALGDPTNFFVFDGVSTDSYAVAVGSDGAFTGCIGYSEGVLFWKEDCLHKVLGTYPANYELHTYSIPGVQAGSGKSMVIINDVLYYKGERGVYAYGGGTPSLLSACFGSRRFTDAVAGSDGEKYYLSVKEGERRLLLVYDRQRGLWLKEDETAVRDFTRLGNQLYFADGAGNVWLVDGKAAGRDLDWTVQFAPFYETIQGRKSYSRLLLRLELPTGSWLAAELRLDGGPWRECAKVVGQKTDVVPLQLPIGRCDKFELRLRGKGECAILSLLREFYVGSEK